jgi:hypothetical protein
MADSMIFVDLEQQTSLKKNDSTISKMYTKEHKLEALRKTAEKTKQPTYIIQKAIYEDKVLYAYIDINKEFVPTGKTVDKNSEKPTVVSKELIYFKPIQTIMNEISKIEAERAGVFDSIKRAETLIEEYIDNIRGETQNDTLEQKRLSAVDNYTKKQVVTPLVLEEIKEKYKNRLGYEK